jgi:hypothetical protein
MTEKEFEPDDPMELVGVELPGNFDEMAECLVEELIRDGWDDENLLLIFQDPFYRLPHQIYREKGEGYVRSLIATQRQKWGDGWVREDISQRLRVDEIKKRVISGKEV